MVLKINNIISFSKKFYFFTINFKDFDKYNNELENENINMINEIFNLKKDLANLSLEKSFIEFKSKDQEKNFKSNLDNLLEKNRQLEKLISDAKKDIEALNKKNNNYEKELFKMNEITKLNENLKLNILNLDNQLNNLKKTNQANQTLIKNLKDEINKKDDQVKEIENDMLEKMNYSSTKLLQYEKDIKNLNSVKSELTNQLENVKSNQNQLKKQEKEIYDLNYKIFNYENELKNKAEENERIRLYIKNNLIEYFTAEVSNNNNLMEIIENLNNYNRNININFDHLVCLVYKK